MTTEGPPQLTIIQFWHDATPLDVVQVMETWRSGPSSGSFCYNRFDDGSARQFIGGHFDNHVLSAFDQCAIPAMRADLFRYCYLYVNGGVYVDADIGCSRNIKELTTGLDRGLLFSRTSLGKEKASDGVDRDISCTSVKLPNGFMIVLKREDKLLRHVLESAVANIETRSCNNVWRVTGPGIMSQLYNSGKKEALELFAGFEIMPESRLREFVHFFGGGTLKYKRSSQHWTTAQKTASIFRDG